MILDLELDLNYPNLKSRLCEILRGISLYDSIQNKEVLNNTIDMYKEIILKTIDENKDSYSDKIVRDELRSFYNYTTRTISFMENPYFFTKLLYEIEKEGKLDIWFFNLILKNKSRNETDSLFSNDLIYSYQRKISENITSKMKDLEFPDSILDHAFPLYTDKDIEDIDIVDLYCELQEENNKNNKIIVKYSEEHKKTVRKYMKVVHNIGVKHFGFKKEFNNFNFIEGMINSKIMLDSCKFFGVSTKNSMYTMYSENSDEARSILNLKSIKKILNDIRKNSSITTLNINKVYYYHIFNLIYNHRSLPKLHGKDILDYVIFTPSYLKEYYKTIRNNIGNIEKVVSTNQLLDLIVTDFNFGNTLPGSVNLEDLLKIIDKIDNTKVDINNVEVLEPIIGTVFKVSNNRRISISSITFLLLSNETKDELLECMIKSFKLPKSYFKNINETKFNIYKSIELTIKYLLALYADVYDTEYKENYKKLLSSMFKDMEKFSYKMVEE